MNNIEQHNMSAAFEHGAGDGDRIYLAVDGEEYSAFVFLKVKKSRGQCHYCQSSTHANALVLKVEELTFDHGGSVPRPKRTKVVEKINQVLLHGRVACPQHASQFKADYIDARQVLEEEQRVRA